MMTNIQPKNLIKNPIHFLSLGFGSGLSPVAPGTMGTLVAVPLYLVLSHYLSQTGYAIVTCVVMLVGVYLCEQTTRALGVHDHPAIVWDEIAGYFITLLFVPVTFFHVVLGFVLFRLFDIVKPWPVSVIDSRMKGGLGVMLDDVIAGLYALALMQLYLYFFA
jgi:phosphatidylglycerophosphatase A